MAGKLSGWRLLIWKIAFAHNVILHEATISVLWGVTLPGISGSSF
jgi:hypothetical protein